TTVREAERLLEYHLDGRGQKVRVAVTAGCRCLAEDNADPSGRGRAPDAAYDCFAEAARDVTPNYAPKTVHTDGWSATSWPSAARLPSSSARVVGDNENVLIGGGADVAGAVGTAAAQRIVDCRVL